MIVCDTGPTVAAADRDDRHNRACTDLLTGLHLARRTILVPAPVVAEVGYLLARTGGPRIEAAFLRSIVQRAVTIVDLELTDYERMADLVETYADSLGHHRRRRGRRRRAALASPRSPHSTGGIFTPSDPVMRTLSRSFLESRNGWRVSSSSTMRSLVTGVLTCVVVPGEDRAPAGVPYRFRTAGFGPRSGCVPLISEAVAGFGRSPMLLAPTPD